MRDKEHLRPRKMHENEHRDCTKPLADRPLAVGGAVRVSRLDTLRHVRREASRLYREARKRSGRYPDATTAYRLSQILAGVARAIELEDVVRRLEALEALRNDANGK